MNDKIINLPNHIAIILDGNGRWAKKKGMPRTFGHKKGCDNLVKIARYCNSIGLKNLTVYAFSTENWSRPKEEVDFLMNLFEIQLTKLIKKKDSNIRVRIIGEKDRLSDKLLSLIDKLEEKTKDYDGLNFNIAINYGSRDEIVHALKEVVESGEEINKDNISKHLYVNDVDLLIRTSGEERISNFLLWQISYAELYFTKVYWPAFNVKELNKAIESYNGRSRRFGNIKEEK